MVFLQPVINYIRDARFILAVVLGLVLYVQTRSAGQGSYTCQETIRQLRQKESVLTHYMNVTRTATLAQNMEVLETTTKPDGTHTTKRVRTQSSTAIAYSKAEDVKVADKVTETKEVVRIVTRTVPRYALGVELVPQTLDYGLYVSSRIYSPTAPLWLDVGYTLNTQMWSLGLRLEF